MYRWLYFIYSNRVFHKLSTYLSHNSELSGIIHFIFTNNITLDDRFFSVNDRFLVSTSFLTVNTNFMTTFARYGLSLDYLVDLNKLPLERYDSSSKYFNIVFDKELESFLRENDFKFRDDSSLIIF